MLAGRVPGVVGQEYLLGAVVLIALGILAVADRNGAVVGVVLVWHGDVLTVDVGGCPHAAEREEDGHKGFDE